jgi:hypothetical protein
VPWDRNSYAKVKRKQAHEADHLAAVASGIGQYGIANACYGLAGILRAEAIELENAEKDLTRAYAHDSVELDAQNDGQTS